MVYGGTTASPDKPSDAGTATIPSFSIKPSAPLMGNLLTLLASFGYGLYQVLYKIYAALPSDPEVAAERLYESIPEDDEESISLTNDNTINGVDALDAVYPSPFGFHPNLLTSLLGFFTMTIMWIPIPFLHWSGAEIFMLPSNAWTIFSIAGIALSGVVFNAGFMVRSGLMGTRAYIHASIIDSLGTLGSNYRISGESFDNCFGADCRCECLKDDSNCLADTYAQLGSLWRRGGSTHFLEFGGLRRHRPRIRRPRLRHVYKEIIEWIPDPCSVCGAGATADRAIW